MSIFKGVGVALVTPMNEKGLDLDEYGRLIDHVLAGGATALIVGGTMISRDSLSPQLKMTIDFPS